MIFLSASIPNASAMGNIFNQLESTTGPQINHMKSKVYFSKDVINKAILLQICMNEDSLPVKYLGVPSSTDYIHASNYSPLMAKVYDKNERRDSTLLSTAGRAELIQSAITPIILHWLLIYQLPSSVLQKLENMCADFFWEANFIK